MQLTNIARDVGEDADAGRLYLPVDWLAEVGIDAEGWLARPAYSDALGTVIQRLLHQADGLYRRAGAGIRWLPVGCQPGIHAARIIYAEIGRELERLGLDSVSRRAVVPLARRARLFGQALIATVRSPEGDFASAPPLTETRFLVEAVMNAPSWPPELAEARTRGVSWWNLTGQLVGVIELFERLERRDRLAHTGDTPGLRRIAPEARGQGWWRAVRQDGIP
jgi:phytoene synthase